MTSRTGTVVTSPKHCRAKTAPTELSHAREARGSARVAASPHRRSNVVHVPTMPRAGVTVGRIRGPLWNEARRHCHRKGTLMRLALGDLMNTDKVHRAVPRSPTKRARLRVALRRFGAASFACIHERRIWTRLAPVGTGSTDGSNGLKRSDKSLWRIALLSRK
jgi:hypothetical protein